MGVLLAPDLMISAFGYPARDPLLFGIRTAAARDNSIRLPSAVPHPLTDPQSPCYDPWNE
ncbi:hypothetical protein ASZ90_010486 [hydrocarbon metagenome]|uniref:Uncharacterized protein n=1 Tax=hydrocarbon metagenome TaxID=938273 RepID=A0A0W8FFY4_9ZZZZ